MLKTLFTATATIGDWHDERPSILERIKSTFSGSGGATKDSEIEAYIQNNGGVLTDELERQISRKFGHIVGG
jgi:hypothetical protein